MARRRRRHALTAHQRRVRAGRKAARTRARRHGGRSRRRAVMAFGTNPRRRYRYRHRRNPRRLSMSGGRFGVKALAVGAGVGAIGAVGLDYLWQYASGYLPASMQTGYVGTLVKAGAAVGAGMLASKLVGRQAAMAGALGALTVVAYQFVHQMIATSAPAVAIPATTTAATPAMSGFNAYMPRGAGMGWVSPGTPLALRGLGNMRAYMGQSMPAAANRPGGTVSASGLAAAGGW